MIGPAGEALTVAFGVLVIGAIASLAMHRRANWRVAGAIATGFAAISTLVCWYLAWQVFVAGKIDIGSDLIMIQALNSSLRFQIDALSALFLMFMPLVSVCSMYYSIEYMRKRYAEESPSRYYPYALILLASIIGVVTTEDLFFFFIFWEVMTISSYFLIVFDRDNLEKVRAGLQYFIVMHIAAALTIVARILTYTHAGSYAFEDIALGMESMRLNAPWMMHVVLLCFFLGFATKAGMFPVAGWLPDAHAAAPSPVSALLSGSIVKLGIYGIVRTFLTFLPASGSSTVWGLIIATFGAASIFFGTITALRQDDCKRVLGFHTIGQIGYILLGIGIGLAFINTSPTIAAIGLIGGLFHMINHTVYKSLLFLNVGAAEYWTGTRDMNKMGGLGALMPYTLAATVVAALSIAGVPPFSGFASKWMIYHSAFQGGLTVPFLLLLGLVGIFISTVTLASFVKLVGAIFLGKTETNGETIKGDVPFSMRVPQYVLSGLCVLFGVLPILPLVLLYKSAASALPWGMPAFADLFGSSNTGLTLSMGGATVGVWNPILALAGLGICTLIAYTIFRSGHAESRQVDSWYCGEEFAPELVRYRSHGFVLPFKQAFDRIYPTIKIPHGQVPPFLQKLFDVDSWLYDPVIRAGARFMEKFSHTHIGIPQIYLLWQIVGVAVVIALLFLIVR